MKNIYTTILVLLLSVFYSFSQDTTWVQTFTFDSITNRHDQFEFPAELNSQRFEKVLMYYKLKCSPLTTWDQYNCGEWDYLTYTRVFDHTGQFDSVQKNSSLYLSNCTTPPTINFNNPTVSAQTYNTYQRNEYFRSNPILQNHVVIQNNTTSNLPFKTSSQGGKFQFVLTVFELNAAGVQPGNIESLSLYLASVANNEGIPFPSIRLKGTSTLNVSMDQTAGFLEVYNRSISAGGLVSGLNEFLFYQPFNWNGTDHIIVELSFDTDILTATNPVFEAENGFPTSSNFYEGSNGVIDFNGNNYALLELSDTLIGPDLTIEFWSKGNAISGQNTTLLEAYDTLGNRIINIHMPWGNNQIYFDAGNQTGYDRINIAMSPSEIQDTWNHWAFVKKQSTGEMFIYKNGVLWHSGTNLNRQVGYVHRFVLGASANQSIKWKGQLDEFRVYKASLPASTILAHYQNKIDNTHPNWNQLMVYYDFDNQNYADDRSINDYKLMLSEGFTPNSGSMIKKAWPMVGVQSLNLRPKVAFGQGSVQGVLDTIMVNQPRLVEPITVFEQAPLHSHFDIVQSYRGAAAGNTYTFNTSGNVIQNSPLGSNIQLLNDSILYFEAPYEIVKDVEIARYITPYGIQFDLGPNGFCWIYDVTDYQMYLKNTVDLAAHNTQELLDLRFAFIEGIPPRDVHKREPIWSDWRSYNYANMANDAVLSAKPMVLNDTSSTFKIKTRMSGHGQVGNAACCEWVPNDHLIRINGIPRFNWNIWQTTECGDNPNIGQGGTWPYAREGWCPGDRVKEHEFELTPFVTPGDTVTIDYGITLVPPNDPGLAGGNYIAAYDLISYSAPNFQNDAAIVDVLNPNNWEYYSKYNPTCSNPRVIIRNTGQQALTSCKIRCWITYGVEISYDWTGNLGFLEEALVEIPVNSQDFWTDYDSMKTFTAYVCNVNGGSGNDDYNQNSVKQTKFNAPERINGPFFIWLSTNNKAIENTYRLIDASGNIIFERNNLSNTTQYKDTFDLAPGCYSVIIDDSDNDGLSFWYSAQVEGETTGQMRLRYVGGSYIEMFPGDFGRYHRYDFSVGFTVGLEENKLDHEIAIFPNPATNQATIEISGSVNNDAQLVMYDIMGRQVLSEKMNASDYFAESYIDLSSLNKGTYIVKIITNQRVYTKELVKQ